MYKFEPVTAEDLQEILVWSSQDIDENHHGLDPLFFFTGIDGSFLCFKIVDADGSATMFVRVEPEGHLGRLHLQFPPESEIPKSKVAKTLLKAFPVFVSEMKKAFDGLVFQTSFPALAAFFQRQGFEPDGTDNFRLNFEAASVAKDK